MYADFSVPYSEWTALTRGTDCMLYLSLLPWNSFRARNCRRQSPISVDTACALALNMYRAGADGLPPYNNFVPTLLHPPFYPQAMQVFHPLRDPNTIAGRERHYIFDPTWAGMTGFGAEGKCSMGAVKAQKILLDRGGPPATGEYLFYLYENLTQAHHATLILRGMGMTENERLEIYFNGRLIPDEAIGCILPSDAQPTSE